MGLWGTGGLKSAGRTTTVADILAALVGQDIVARSIQLTQAAAANALLMVTGARLKLGGGSLDYFTSDGAITITSAGSFTVGGDLTLGASSDAVFGRDLRINRKVLLGINMAFQAGTAPTVVAGAGASVTANNGTAAFTIDLGGAAQTGTITLPAASAGYVCYMQNVTNPAANVIGQTGGTQTTVTFTNYSRTTGLAANWTANDVMRCLAIAY